MPLASTLLSLTLAAAANAHGSANLSENNNNNNIASSFHLRSSTHTNTKNRILTTATFTGAGEQTACLTLEACDAKRQSMGILNFYAGEDFLTKGCYEKNGNAAFWSPGTVEEMTSIDLTGVQKRVWCDCDADMDIEEEESSPTPTFGPSVDSLAITSTGDTTPTPTASPSVDSLAATTISRTDDPLMSPTKSPTDALGESGDTSGEPTDTNPTKTPSDQPTKDPLSSNSINFNSPTQNPVKSPSIESTKEPTSNPTKSPSPSVQLQPTKEPTNKAPTSAPTSSPVATTTTSTSAPSPISPTKSPSTPSLNNTNTVADDANTNITEETACLTLEACDAKRQSMGILNFYAGEDYLTKGCYEKNGNAAFWSPGTVEEMTSIELTGVQKRVWCDTTETTTDGGEVVIVSEEGTQVVPTVSPSVDSLATVEEMTTPVACFTEEQCKEQSLAMGMETFKADNYPTKGCFEVSGWAFFSPGTEEEILQSKVSGLQERIWCVSGSVSGSGSDVSLGDSDDTSGEPTKSPTENPSDQTSKDPLSSSLFSSPTQNPVKSSPIDSTKEPTSKPTKSPSNQLQPTKERTNSPTIVPTTSSVPTSSSVATSTSAPSSSPTKSPSLSSNNTVVDNTTVTDADTDQDDTTPCLTEAACEKKSQEMGFTEFYSGANFQAAKGCFSRDNMAFFGTGGSVEEMSMPDLAGVHERIWCSDDDIVVADNAEIDATETETVSTLAPTDVPTKEPTSNLTVYTVGALPSDRGDTTSPTKSLTTQPSKAPTAMSDQTDVVTKVVDGIGFETNVESAGAMARGFDSRVVYAVAVIAGAALCMH